MIEQKGTDRLIDAHAVADLLGISARSFRRMNDTGRAPRPIRVGPRLIRWRRDEIAAWIDAGCPDRAAWDALRKKAARIGERS